MTCFSSFQQNTNSDVTNVPIYSRSKQEYINVPRLLLNFASKICCQFVSNLQRNDIISAHVRALQFASEKLQYICVAFKKKPHLEVNMNIS